jgi:urease gamma subunit
MNAAQLKSPRPLHPKSADTKYTGLEPEWRVQPEAENRASRVIAAFTWYNYHYDKRTVKELIIDWLVRNDRQRDAKEFGRVPESTIRNQTGWLCRMNTMGLTLNEHELLAVDGAIADHLRSVRAVKEVVREATEIVNRPTIQDRLREKVGEAAGEIEGMYDDMILAGARMSADYKPITILRGMNVAPQMVGEIADQWRRRLEELEEAARGKDAQLVEGYGNFGKIQIKNLAKFAEQVIADCGSYVQIKKVERKPRKKKPISPERQTQKFKYLAEFEELKLKSEPVTRLVNAQEAWLYDTKKRKLIYVMADTHAGSFTVKNNNLIGFDPTNSVQKTLRKPAEQIRALLQGGVAQHRKSFKDIKATEVKFNGRGNENLILLKIR